MSVAPRARRIHARLFVAALLLGVPTLWSCGTAVRPPLTAGLRLAEDDPDRQRVEQVHLLARWCEEFEEKTGEYPLADGTHPLPLEVMWGLDPVSSDKNVLPYELLLEELRKVLGEEISLPPDPAAKDGDGRPRTYRYFTDREQYRVSVDLDVATEFTGPAAEGRHSYTVSSLLEADRGRFRLVDVEGLGGGRRIDEALQASLEASVVAGDRQGVTEALERGALVNPVCSDEGYHHPLTMAVVEDRAAMIGLLVGHGADVDVRDGGGDTPLYTAVRLEKLEAMEALLEAGADPNLRNDLGLTPLLQACAMGRAPLVERLVRHGGDLDGCFYCPERSVRCLGTPLIVSIRTGSLPVVQTLLELGADPEMPDGKGYTPAVHAAQAGLTEVLGLLLRSGADPNGCHPDLEYAAHSLRPLDAAILGDQIEAVSLLLENGADPDLAVDDGLSCLARACFKGRAEMVDLMLEHGADPLACHRSYDEMADCAAPPITAAAVGGHTSIVRRLLDRGADPDQPNSHGYTAVGCAAADGHLETLQLLLQRGADPDLCFLNQLTEQECDGTPLGIATAWGHVEVVRLLLQEGADPDRRDGRGKTALDYARQLGREEIVRLLAGEP